MLHPKSFGGQKGDHTLYTKPSIYCWLLLLAEFNPYWHSLHCLINTKEISVTIWQLTFVSQGKPPASYPFVYTCHRKLWRNGPPSAAAGRAFTPGTLQQVDNVLRNLLGECNVCGESFWLLLAGRWMMLMIPSSSLQDLLGAFFSFSSMPCSFLTGQQLCTA